LWSLRQQAFRCKQRTTCNLLCERKRIFAAGV